MSDHNQTPVANQHYSPQVPHPFQNNDEIDLRELFKALWDGKWVITALTVLFAVAAAVFALKQPNIYQSQASFVSDTSFYGSGEVNELRFAPQFYSSNELRQSVLSEVPGKEPNLAGVNISYDKKNESITVSKLSTDPQAAFDGVVLFSNVFNQALKSSELAKVNVSIEALLSSSQITSDKTQDYLDELLAQQLFKKALLENPNSKLVRQINEPVKPTSHIKPKRALIITLGTLLGGMLGVAIVLVRFAFRREED